MRNSARLFKDSGAWARMVADVFVAQSTTKHLFITDIDDTILNSMEQWYLLYVYLSEKRRVYPLIGRDEFASLGPRKFIEPLVEDYVTFKDLMMSDEKLHSNMHPTTSVSEAIGSFEKYKIPNGYITARPEAIGKITMINLRNQGLNTSPVLLRSGVEYSESNNYKIKALRMLRKHIDKVGLENVSIYYVDDFVEFINQVNSLDPGIVGIRFDSDFNWKRFISEKLLEGAT